MNKHGYGLAAAVVVAVVFVVVVGFVVVFVVVAIVVFIVICVAAVLDGAVVCLLRFVRGLIGLSSVFLVFFFFWKLVIVFLCCKGFLCSCRYRCM